MNKIGILTYFNENNYGAVLQAYALSEALKRLGSYPVMLEMPAKEQRKTDNTKAGFIERLKQAALKRKKLFDRFREKNFCGSDIRKCRPEEFQAFITGSDQVFNPELSCWSPEYLLGFVPKRKRFSYAASFGGCDLSGPAKDRFSKELLEFSCVSLREDSQKAANLGVSPGKTRLDLDPVLLLEKEHWLDMAGRNERDPFLFVYLIQDNPDLAEKASRLAKKMRADLVVCTGGFIPSLGIKAWSAFSPEDWVSLMVHSQGVVTNSYHGLLFSLLFNKSFLFCPLSRRLQDRNTRFMELKKISGFELNKWNQPNGRDWLNSDYKVFRNQSRKYLAKIADSLYDSSEESDDFKN